MRGFDQATGHTGTRARLGRRRMLGVVLAGALATASIGLTAPAAHAALPTIEVTLRLADGSLPPSGGVTAYRKNDAGAWVWAAGNIASGAVHELSIPGVMPAEIIVLADVNDNKHAPRFIGGGYTPATAEVITVTDDSTVSRSITLQVGARIRGAVVDADGDPVAGASVISNWDTQLFQQRGVTTNAEGRYSLGGIPPARMAVHVSRDGYAGRGIGGYAMADWTRMLTGLGTVRNAQPVVLEGAGTLTGSIDHGADGAWVQANVQDRTGTWRYYTSAPVDDANEFSIPNLPPVPIALQFSADGHVDSWYPDVRHSDLVEAVTPVSGVTTTGLDATIFPTSDATVPATASVSFTGTPKVGATLWATVSGWDDSIDQTFQWYVDELPIAGATSRSFKVRPQDVGKVLQFAVTGWRGGEWPSTLSFYTATIAPGTFTAPSVWVSGTAKVGRTLTARTGTVPSGATVTYAWFKGSTRITGLTSKTTTVRSSWKGAKIRVQAKFVRPGYTTVTKLSAFTATVQ